MWQRGQSSFFNYITMRSTNYGCKAACDPSGTQAITFRNAAAVTSGYLRPAPCLRTGQRNAGGAGRHQVTNACRAQPTIAEAGIAPDCRATSRPFENRMIVGIERIA